MNESEQADEVRDRFRDVLGSICLFLGMGLLGLILADRAGGLPVNMPRSWYTDHAVWVGAGLAAFAAGWRLLGDRGGPQRPAAADGQAPTARPQFERVVLFTRTGCHLCDLARQTLEKYGDSLPPPIEVDIDRVPSLRERFTNCVPVVEIDGKIRFRGRVNEILLRRLIAAAAGRQSGVDRDPQEKSGAG